jgi:lysozyme family protein
MSHFDAAVGIVIGIEAGYVNDPKDPGLETKFGISKRRYPNEDIQNLTLDRAKALYQRDYWNSNGCESMPWEQALLVFDASVNGGFPKRWHDMYAGYPAADFIENFQAEHSLYLAGLPGWITYGRGWMRRAFKIARLAGKQP